MDRLDPRTTLILVVDVQEKLAAAMPEASLATLVKNTGILLEAAKELGVPVLASEQYPKGLGPTVPAVAERLARLDRAALPKVTFDACSDLAIARAISDVAPRAVVVVGMEAHVCVFQTARELVKRGYLTHVVADAVSSRQEDNRRLGLALAERAGAIVTTTETVVFDLLGRAGTDAFKAVSKLIR
ncbi:MAG: isochorismatase family protein [Labilithrix sp.]|nr:isochorismatase family protein [Labilithrix sp.]MCW5835518.1 isochorismatase family protein [Labilithrix sp.]